MRKAFIAVAAAAVLAAGTLVSPQPAKADPISAWWLVPAVLGGLWLGGAVAAGPAYGSTYGAYGYYARPAGFANCWQERRRIHGAWRTVQVCY
ncbi:MAG: hypothetical protein IT539_03150 [Bradyrhizobiaceae bacterium]|nr:hypothetical protein [Bradyrhizobiaceae bacterium]